MALRGIPGFVGMRTRFQRVTDRKQFTGWVEAITPTYVVIRVPPTEAVFPGDVFVFTLFGEVESATFQAQFACVHRLDMDKANEQTVGLGTLVEVQETSIEFTILTTIDFNKSTLDARKYANSEVGIVRNAEGTHDIWVVDVSIRGLGFICQKPFSIGDKLEIEMRYGSWLLEMQAEVRHCQHYPLMDGMHQTGVQLAEMDRLLKAKWRTFYENS
jgi:hypothetical protein